MAAKKNQDDSALAAVYAVYGPEAFLKQQALDEITCRVLGNADRSLSLNEYEGRTAELARVMDDLRTLPFLAERRLVVIRDADPFISEFRNELEDYATNPSPTGVLVLEAKSLPGNTRLHKRIAALGGTRPCEAIKSRNLNAWLISRASAGYSKKLEAPAAVMLIELVGNDLGLLNAELTKLALYADERQNITIEDVKALVGQQREEEIWEIMSAMATGDEAAALSLWEKVWLTDKAAQARSIPGIAFKVRQLLKAKQAQAAGASQSELASILMLWGNPQRVQAELNGFSTPYLERILQRLLEADVAAKSGGLSVRSSVESLIIKVCRATQSHKAVRT